MSTRAPIRVLVALALVWALASCGGKSGSGDAGTTKTAGPGAGKPPVTIGTKNFPEAFVLGQLYAQALEAKGFRVNLKSNVGATEIIYRALTSSTLDMYPEYTGVVTAVVGNRRQRAHDEESAYREAQRIANARGLALLDHTPFSDRDAIAVKPEYAKRWGLRSVADLAKVPGKVKFGGPPEFRTREQGYVGLRTVYGLTNLRFLPLRIGEQYQDLSSGKVDAADVFTTDGELISGGYVVLKDPKDLFGFQNAAPFVRQSVVAREGPVFVQTLNAVSALLTTREMQRMNAAVVVQQKSPASVADAFLRDHRLK